MTISVKHAFQSAKADGTDSTLVQPSNWNAEHTITLAAGKVLGRDSSGAGAVQELPLSLDAAGNLSMSATAYFVPAVGTTAQRPASPATGAFRYNTTAGKFEGYSGTAWGSIGGGATVSDTAPASPANGDLWWKSDEGQMYVYYTDANSSQWVVANAYAGGAAYLPLAGGTLTGTLNGVNASFSGTLSGTINGSNLVATSVAVAKLNATGTPSATTYLRGDGTWSTPASNPGTVTSITAGTGLSGGTITTSGTIALVTTASAVGTYAFLYATANVTIGGTYAGSVLKASAVVIQGNCVSTAWAVYASGAAQSGTWQAMGTGSGSSGFPGAATLFVRIA